MQRFKPDGSFRISYPATLPYGINVDGNGNIFVAERMTGYIRCVNNTKLFAGKGVLENQFTNPIGLTIADGKVWTTDVTTGKIKSAMIR